MNITKDHLNEEVELIWNKTGTLQEEQNIFIDAFYKTYKELHLSELEIQDLYLFLHETFNNEIKDAANHTNNLVWVSAVIQKKEVVGYASFDINPSLKEIYIRHLVVKPEKQQRGIGKHLVFAIKNKYPVTKKLLVLVRKVNQNAHLFYQHLGFKQGSYTHQGYNQNLYDNLEFVFNK